MIAELNAVVRRGMAAERRARRAVRACVHRSRVARAGGTVVAVVAAAVLVDGWLHPPHMAVVAAVYAAVAAVGEWRRQPSGAKR